MKSASSSSIHKKTTSWTLSSTSRADQSTVKTIPIDAAAPDKNISQQQNTQAAGINMTSFPAAGHGPTDSTIVQKENNCEINKDIVPENNNMYQYIPLVKDDKRQKPKEHKRTRSSSISSPRQENNIVSTKTTTLLPHSLSSPGPNWKKERVLRGGNDNDITRETQGKFDPIVGMSIIIVTLAIMLIWGKLCAILCTFAWLFLVPRLRNVDGSMGKELNSGSLDLESEEYKKKVVLEGLLQRDRRRVVGIL